MLGLGLYSERLFYHQWVATPARCPRCLELEDQVYELQQRLAALGQYVTYSLGPNTIPNMERELQRWLSVSPRASAADGFRAGWSHLARFVRPTLRDSNARWVRCMRDNESLRLRIGVLLMEVSRLTDGG
jgi:hypothetical protein